MTDRGRLRVALLLLAAAVLLARASTGNEAYTVALGHIVEHEAQPCTFRLGSAHTLLVLHPLNVTCQRLRELAGRSVRLRVELVMEDTP